MRLLSSPYIFFPLLLVIVISGILYSGIINVSAMAEEPAWLKTVIEKTREQSVKKQALDIKVPDLKNPLWIAEGHGAFRDMCVDCHVGPGDKISLIALGMNPAPPKASDLAKNLNAKELFWVTKNGIRMTGMPAWGRSHSDNELWPIIAFLQKLAVMNESDYQAMNNRPLAHDHSSHRH